MADDALEMATVKRALTGSRCRHPGARRFGRARNHPHADTVFLAGRRTLRNGNVVECRAATPGQPTRPNLTGSSPTPKTIGIAEVASFAARAASGKPGVTMTATRRRTKSAVSIGSVSYRPSTHWYLTVTF